jgi:hypothetical protein
LVISNSTHLNLILKRRVFSGPTIHTPFKQPHPTTPRLKDENIHEDHDGTKAIEKKKLLIRVTCSATNQGHDRFPEPCIPDKSNQGTHLKNQNQKDTNKSRIRLYSLSGQISNPPRNHLFAVEINRATKGANTGTRFNIIQDLAEIPCSDHLEYGGPAFWLGPVQGRGPYKAGDMAC